MLQEYLLEAHPTATTNDACRALPPSAMDQVMIRVGASYDVELKLNVRANKKVVTDSRKQAAVGKVAINFVLEHFHHSETVSPLRRSIDVFHSASSDGRAQKVVARISRRRQRFCCGLP